MAREIRDVLAECMRRERLGLMRPLWEDLQRFADDECEQFRRRADHLIRLLRDYGLEIVRTGESSAPPSPEAANTVWRYALTGQQDERIIRKGEGDSWLIVKIADSKEEVEQTFTLAEAHVNAGLVLIDAPEAKKIPGLGRQLAALSEIYRVHAAAEGSK